MRVESRNFCVHFLGVIWPIEFVLALLKSICVPTVLLLLLSLFLSLFHLFRISHAFVCGSVHVSACLWFNTRTIQSPRSLWGKSVRFVFVSLRVLPQQVKAVGNCFNCFSCSHSRPQKVCGRALFAVSYLLEAFHLPIFSQFKSALHENDNNSASKQQTATAPTTPTEAVAAAVTQRLASQAPKAASSL